MSGMMAWQTFCMLIFWYMCVTGKPVDLAQVPVASRATLHQHKVETDSPSDLSALLDLACLPQLSD